MGDVRINDGPNIKPFILVGLARFFFCFVFFRFFFFFFFFVVCFFFFFVYCFAHRGSTVGFLLLQCSSVVVREPKGSPGVGHNTLFLSSPVKPV